MSDSYPTPEQAKQQINVPVGSALNTNQGLFSRLTTMFSLSHNPGTTHPVLEYANESDKHFVRL